MKVANAIIRIVAIISISTSMMSQSGNTIQAWCNKIKHSPSTAKDNPGTTAAIIGAAVALGLVYKHRDVIRKKVLNTFVKQKTSEQ